MTNSEAICGLLVASLFVFFTNVAPVMADEWIQLQRGDLVLTDEEFELITEEMLLLDPRMLSGFRVSGNIPERACHDRLVPVSTDQTRRSIAPAA